LSDLGEEFGKRFKDFAEIGKLSQFLKYPFEVSPTGEWIDGPPYKLIADPCPTLCDSIEIKRIRQIHTDIKA